MEHLIKAKNLFFILLGVDIALTAVVGLNAFLTIGTLQEIQSGTRIVDQSLTSNLEFWENFATLTILSLIGVGLCLVKWLNACYAYAMESIGAVGFKNKKWTTAGWIIPIFNLFKPYQIINEIYKAGAPGYANADDWKKENSSGLLLMWWIFWVVTHLVMFSFEKVIFHKSTQNNLTLPQIIDLYDLKIWGVGISIVIAVLWFAVANHLTQRLLGRQSIRSSNSVRLTPSQVQATKTSEVETGRSHLADVPLAVENYYDIAANELATGNKDKTLWNKLFVEADGDENKTKARYIRLRAKVLAEDDEDRIIRSDAVTSSNESINFQTVSSAKNDTELNKTTLWAESSDRKSAQQTIKIICLFLARLIGIYVVCTIIAVFSYHFHDPAMSAYQIGVAFRESGLRDGLLLIAALLSLAFSFL